MIKVGNYYVYSESIGLAVLIVKDFIKVNTNGIPRRENKDLESMARQILLENTQGNLVYAGQGHFRLMWVSDLGIAIKGILKVIDYQTIQTVLQFIIDESAKVGHVYTSYSYSRGLEVPCPRGDSLPWLLHCVNEYVKASNDTSFLRNNKQKLQELLTNYENTHLDAHGTVLDSITGDWMDTVKRPSSTWNNVLAVSTSKIARSLGFTSTFDWKTQEQRLIKERFKKNYLIDYVDTTNPSIDSAILAVYLDLFSLSTRKTLAEWIKSAIRESQDNRPFFISVYDYPSDIVPVLTKITCPDYHSKAQWLFMGLMYLNGVKNLGMEFKPELASIEKIFHKYHNFVETVDSDGNILKDLMTTDYGFTMSVGQYLELVTSSN